MNKYLGIEIGGTKQQIAVGTADGTITESESVKLGAGSRAEDILDWLFEKADAVIGREAVTAIGIGFGGPLESASGRVLCSLQIPGWKDFELRSCFESRYGIRTAVVNDTVAGGLAELRKGAGKGSARFFYTNIGTGIGGSLFIDGKYYDGSGCGASYLGNSLIPDIFSDTPGQAVRLELICSGKSISERLNRKGYVPEDSALGKMIKEGKSISAAELKSAAEEGDAFACDELDRIAESFSTGLVNVLALEGPDRIVIGGGVAKMGPILFDRIRRFTDMHAFIADKGRYEIMESRLMDDAVLAGALMCASENIYA